MSIKSDKNKIKSTKEEIEKRINELNTIQNSIKKELQVLHKEIEDIAKVKNKEYIGKCYKRDMYDESIGSTIYYRVLEISESNSNNFWVLSVKYPDEDVAISTSYISKELINFLGNKEFFLRQLTPISEKEFIEAIDNVYDHLMDMNGKVTNKKVEHFELKCPNCDSLGPIVDLCPNITDVEYTCEKCGCRFKTIFQNGKCIFIQEM